MEKLSRLNHHSSNISFFYRLSHHFSKTGKYVWATKVCHINIHIWHIYPNFAILQYDIIWSIILLSTLLLYPHYYPYDPHYPYYIHLLLFIILYGYPYYPYYPHILDILMWILYFFIIHNLIHIIIHISRYCHAAVGWFHKSQAVASPFGL